MTPDAPMAANPSYGALLYVAAVNLIIWVGLFAYLVYLDRKVRGALSRHTPEDPR
jgi:CcmD family protein